MSERDHRYDDAASMISKLRQFAATLDEGERAALYRLLVPGVANAFDEREVNGHAAATWSPDAMPEWLVSAIADQGLRLQGLE